MKQTTKLQNQIITLLQWDDGRYEKFVFECGNAYLYAYIKFEADEIINEIKRSLVFWNWWKHHWALRDAAFIELFTPGQLVDKQVARQYFQEMHDPAMLAAELHPSGEVLGESYARMIGKLNSSVLEKGVPHA